MEELLSREGLKYIISQVIDNAKDAIEERKGSSENDKAFFDGKVLAYYEVLDTIKNRLMVRQQDLKEFGLDFDLEQII